MTTTKPAAASGVRYSATPSSRGSTMPVAPSSSQQAVNRISGSGNGATPVCPLAISLGLDHVAFSAPETAKTAASSPCSTHKNVFIRPPPCPNDAARGARVTRPRAAPAVLSGREVTSGRDVRAVGPARRPGPRHPAPEAECRRARPGRPAPPPPAPGPGGGGGFLFFGLV